MPSSALYRDVSVIIPAVDERASWLRTVKAALERLGSEVIIVDDGSKRPFADAIKHGQTYGYGAAILTGVKQATRPLILTMDGDGQHTLDDVAVLIGAWLLYKGRLDMLVGHRRLRTESWLRRWGRKGLNTIASLFVGHWLPDLNSGLRLLKRDILLGYASILCPSFSFTTSLTISMLCDDYRVEWFPIPVHARQSGQSKVRLWRHGWTTLYYIVRNGLALRTRRVRAWLRRLRGKR